MTYSLPFGLTQKPTNHYFEHGVIKFSVREGVLHFKIKRITKKVNADLMIGIVKSKKDLDTLLSIKSLDDIRLIEEVVS